MVHILEILFNNLFDINFSDTKNRLINNNKNTSYSSTLHYPLLDTAFFFEKTINSKYIFLGWNFEIPLAWFIVSLYTVYLISLRISLVSGDIKNTPISFNFIKLFYTYIRERVKLNFFFNFLISNDKKKLAILTPFFLFFNQLRLFLFNKDTREGYLEFLVSRTSRIYCKIEICLFLLIKVDVGIYFGCFLFWYYFEIMYKIKEILTKLIISSCLLLVYEPPSSRKLTSSYKKSTLTGLGSVDFIKNFAENLYVGLVLIILFFYIFISVWNSGILFNSVRSYMSWKLWGYKYDFLRYINKFHFEIENQFLYANWVVLSKPTFHKNVFTGWCSLITNNYSFFKKYYILLIRLFIYLFDIVYSNLENYRNFFLEIVFYKKMIYSLIFNLFVLLELSFVAFFYFYDYNSCILIYWLSKIGKKSTIRLQRYWNKIFFTLFNRFYLKYSFFYKTLNYYVELNYFVTLCKISKNIHVIIWRFVQFYIRKWFILVLDIVLSLVTPLSLLYFFIKNYIYIIRVEKLFRLYQFFLSASGKIPSNWVVYKNSSNAYLPILFSRCFNFFLYNSPVYRVFYYYLLKFKILVNITISPINTILGVGINLCSLLVVQSIRLLVLSSKILVSGILIFFARPLSILYRIIGVVFCIFKGTLVIVWYDTIVFIKIISNLILFGIGELSQRVMTLTFIFLILISYKKIIFIKSIISVKSIDIIFQIFQSWGLDFEYASTGIVIKSVLIILVLIELFSIFFSLTLQKSILYSSVYLTVLIYVFGIFIFDDYSFFYTLLYKTNIWIIVFMWIFRVLREEDRLYNTIYINPHLVMDNSFLFKSDRVFSAIYRVRDRLHDPFIEAIYLILLYIVLYFIFFDSRELFSTDYDFFKVGYSNVVILSVSLFFLVRQSSYLVNIWLFLAYIIFIFELLSIFLFYIGGFNYFSILTLYSQNETTLLSSLGLLNTLLGLEKVMYDQSGFILNWYYGEGLLVQVPHLSELDFNDILNTTTSPFNPLGDMRIQPYLLKPNDDHNWTITSTIENDYFSSIRGTSTISNNISGDSEKFWLVSRNSYIKFGEYLEYDLYYGLSHINYIDTENYFDTSPYSYTNILGDGFMKNLVTDIFSIFIGPGELDQPEIYTLNSWGSNYVPGQATNRFRGGMGGYDNDNTNLLSENQKKKENGENFHEWFPGFYVLDGRFDVKHQIFYLKFFLYTIIPITFISFYFTLAGKESNYFDETFGEQEVSNYNFFFFGNEQTETISTYYWNNIFNSNFEWISDKGLTDPVAYEPTSDMFGHFFRYVNTGMFNTSILDSFFYVPILKLGDGVHSDYDLKNFLMPILFPTVFDSKSKFTSNYLGKSIDIGDSLERNIDKMGTNGFGKKFKGLGVGEHGLAINSEKSSLFASKLAYEVNLEYSNLFESLINELENPEVEAARGLEYEFNSEVSDDSTEEEYADPEGNYNESGLFENDTVIDDPVSAYCSEWSDFNSEIESIQSQFILTDPDFFEKNKFSMGKEFIDKFDIWKNDYNYEGGHLSNWGKTNSNIFKRLKDGLRLERIKTRLRLRFNKIRRTVLFIEDTSIPLKSLVRRLQGSAKKASLSTFVLANHTMRYLFKSGLYIKQGPVFINKTVFNVNYFFTSTSVKKLKLHSVTSLPIIKFYLLKNFLLFNFRESVAHKNKINKSKISNSLGTNYVLTRFSRLVDSNIGNVAIFSFFKKRYDILNFISSLKKIHLSLFLCNNCVLSTRLKIKGITIPKLNRNFILKTYKNILKSHLIKTKLVNVVNFKNIKLRFILSRDYFGVFRYFYNFLKIRFNVFNRRIITTKNTKFICRFSLKGTFSNNFTSSRFMGMDNRILYTINHRYTKLNQNILIKKLNKTKSINFFLQISKKVKLKKNKSVNFLKYTVLLKQKKLNITKVNLSAPIYLMEKRYKGEEYLKRVWGFSWSYTVFFYLFYFKKILIKNSFKYIDPNHFLPQVVPLLLMFSISRLNDILVYSTAFSKVERLILKRLNFRYSYRMTNVIFPIKKEIPASPFEYKFYRDVTSSIFYNVLTTVIRYKNNNMGRNFIEKTFNSVDTNTYISSYFSNAVKSKLKYIMPNSLGYKRIKFNIYYFLILLKLKNKKKILKGFNNKKFYKKWGLFIFKIFENDFLKIGRLSANRMRESWSKNNSKFTELKPNVLSYFDEVVLTIISNAHIDYSGEGRFNNMIKWLSDSSGSLNWYTQSISTIGDFSYTNIFFDKRSLRLYRYDKNFWLYNQKIEVHSILLWIYSIWFFIFKNNYILKMYKKNLFWYNKSDKKKRNKLEFFYNLVNSSFFIELKDAGDVDTNLNLNPSWENTIRVWEDWYKIDRLYKNIKVVEIPITDFFFIKVKNRYFRSLLYKKSSLKYINFNNFDLSYGTIFNKLYGISFFRYFFIDRILFLLKSGFMNKKNIAKYGVDIVSYIVKNWKLFEIFSTPHVGNRDYLEEIDRKYMVRDMITKFDFHSNNFLKILEGLRILFVKDYKIYLRFEKFEEDPLPNRSITLLDWYTMSSKNVMNLKNTKSMFILFWLSGLNKFEFNSYHSSLYSIYGNRSISKNTIYLWSLFNDITSIPTIPFLVSKGSNIAKIVNYDRTKDFIIGTAEKNLANYKDLFFSRSSNQKYSYKVSWFEKKKWIIKNRNFFFKSKRLKYSRFFFLLNNDLIFFIKKQMPITKEDILYYRDYTDFFFKKIINRLLHPNASNYFIKNKFRLNLAKVVRNSGLRFIGRFFWWKKKDLKYKKFKHKKKKKKLFRKIEVWKRNKGILTPKKYPFTMNHIYKNDNIVTGINSEFNGDNIRGVDRLEEWSDSSAESDWESGDAVEIPEAFLDESENFLISYLKIKYKKKLKERIHEEVDFDYANYNFNKYRFIDDEFAFDDKVETNYTTHWPTKKKNIFIDKRLLFEFIPIFLEGKWSGSDSGQTTWEYKSFNRHKERKKYEPLFAVFSIRNSRTFIDWSQLGRFNIDPNSYLHFLKNINVFMTDNDIDFFDDKIIHIENIHLMLAEYMRHLFISRWRLVNNYTGLVSNSNFNFISAFLHELYYYKFLIYSHYIKKKLRNNLGTVVNLKYRSNFLKLKNKTKLFTIIFSEFDNFEFFFRTNKTNRRSFLSTNLGSCYTIVDNPTLLYESTHTGMLIPNTFNFFEPNSRWSTNRISVFSRLNYGSNRKKTTSIVSFLKPYRAFYMSDPYQSVYFDYDTEKPYRDYIYFKHYGGWTKKKKNAIKSVEDFNQKTQIDTDTYREFSRKDSILKYTRNWYFSNYILDSWFYKLMYSGSWADYTDFDADLKVNRSQKFKNGLNYRLNFNTELWWTRNELPDYNYRRIDSPFKSSMGILDSDSEFFHLHKGLTDVAFLEENVDNFDTELPVFEKNILDPEDPALNEDGVFPEDDLNIQYTDRQSMYSDVKPTNTFDLFNEIFELLHSRLSYKSRGMGSPILNLEPTNLFQKQAYPVDLGDIVDVLSNKDVHPIAYSTENVYKDLIDQKIDEAILLYTTSNIKYEELFHNHVLNKNYKKTYIDWNYMHMADNILDINENFISLGYDFILHKYTADYWKITLESDSNWSDLYTPSFPQIHDSIENTSEYLPIWNYDPSLWEYHGIDYIRKPNSTNMESKLNLEFKTRYGNTNYKWLAQKDLTSPGIAIDSLGWGGADILSGFGSHIPYDFLYASDNDSDVDLLAETFFLDYGPEKVTATDGSSDNSRTSLTNTEEFPKYGIDVKRAGRSASDDFIKKINKSSGYLNFYSNRLTKSKIFKDRFWSNIYSTYSKSRLLKTVKTDKIIDLKNDSTNIDNYNLNVIIKSGFHTELGRWKFNSKIPDILRKKYKDYDLLSRMGGRKLKRNKKYELLIKKPGRKSKKKLNLVKLKNTLNLTPPTKFNGPQLLGLNKNEFTIQSLRKSGVLGKGLNNVGGMGILSVYSNYNSSFKSFAEVGVLRSSSIDFILLSKKKNKLRLVSNLYLCKSYFIESNYRLEVHKKMPVKNRNIIKIPKVLKNKLNFTPLWPLQTPDGSKNDLIGPVGIMFYNLGILKVKQKIMNPLMLLYGRRSILRSFYKKTDKLKKNLYNFYFYEYDVDIDKFKQIPRYEYLLYIRLLNKKVRKSIHLSFYKLQYLNISLSNLLLDLDADTSFNNFSILHNSIPTVGSEWPYGSSLFDSLIKKDYKYTGFSFLKTKYKVLPGSRIFFKFFLNIKKSKCLNSNLIPTYNKYIRLNRTKLKFSDNLNKLKFTAGLLAPIVGNNFIESWSTSTKSSQSNTESERISLKTEVSTDNYYSDTTTDYFFTSLGESEYIEDNNLDNPDRLDHKNILKKKRKFQINYKKGDIDDSSIWSSGTEYLGEQRVLYPLMNYNRIKKKQKKKRNWRYFSHPDRVTNHTEQFWDPTSQDFLDKVSEATDHEDSSEQLDYMFSDQYDGVDISYDNKDIGGVGYELFSYIDWGFATDEDDLNTDERMGTGGSFTADLLRDPTTESVYIDFLENEYAKELRDFPEEVIEWTVSDFYSEIVYNHELTDIPISTNESEMYSVYSNNSISDFFVDGDGSGGEFEDSTLYISDDPSTSYSEFESSTQSTPVIDLFNENEILDQYELNIGAIAHRDVDVFTIPRSVSSYPNMGIFENSNPTITDFSNENKVSLYNFDQGSKVELEENTRNTIFFIFNQKYINSFKVETLLNTLIFKINKLESDGFQISKNLFLEKIVKYPPNVLSYREIIFKKTEYLKFYRSLMIELDLVAYMY